MNPSSTPYYFMLAFDPRMILGMLGSLLLLVMVIGGLWIWYKSTDEPGKLVKKWIYSVIIIGGGMSFIAKNFQGTTTLGAIFIAATAAMMGILLAAVWGRAIIERITNPFLALFDGGSEAPERKPLYSIGIGRRKKGDVKGSIAWIQTQLEAFPEDTEGYRLLMEIYLEEYQDSLRAEETLDEYFEQFEGSPPRAGCYLIHYLADWKLSIDHDQAAAESLLRKIISYYPGTEASRKATEDLKLLEEKLHRVMHMHAGESIRITIPDEASRNKALSRPENSMAVGLNSQFPDPAMLSESDMETLQEKDQREVQRLTDRLSAFPSDWESREELARIYAFKLKRLDLAENEIRTLIANPSGSKISWTSKWLNRLVDYQLSLCDTPEEASRTLQELMEKCAGPEAAKAKNRMSRILIEQKGAKARLRDEG